MRRDKLRFLKVRLDRTPSLWRIYKSSPLSSETESEKITYKHVWERFCNGYDDYEFNLLMF